MNFYASISKKNGAGGGCKGIELAITRDKHALDHQAKAFPAGTGRFANMLVDPLLQIPFGIRDQDYSSKPQARIFSIRRHSFENYLFDPFILFSVLTAEDLQSFSEDFKLRCINYVDTLRKSNVELPNEPLMKYFKFLITQVLKSQLKLQDIYRICEILMPDTPKIDLFRITRGDLKLPQYYSIKFFETFGIHQSEYKNYEQAIGNDKPLLQLIMNVCNHILQRQITDENELLDFLMSRNTEIKVLLYNKKSLKIHYPNILLFIRGHLIEDAIPYLKSKKSEILLKLSYMDNILVPLDLAETFFELDNAIRTQLNNVIKSDSNNQKVIFQIKINSSRTFPFFLQSLLSVFPCFFSISFSFVFPINCCIGCSLN